MKKMHLSSRLLSLLLIVALLFSFAVPVGAANSGSNVSFKQVDNSAVSGSLQEGIPEEEPDGLDYADAEVVRVSIVLDKESTIEAGFSHYGHWENQEAMSYRAGLQREQANMTASIEKAIGEKAGCGMEPDPGGQYHFRQCGLWEDSANSGASRRQGRDSGDSV